MNIVYPKTVAFAFDIHRHEYMLGILGHHCFRYPLPPSTCVHGLCLKKWDKCSYFGRKNDNNYETCSNFIKPKLYLNIVRFRDSRYSSIGKNNHNKTTASGSENWVPHSIHSHCHNWGSSSQVHGHCPRIKIAS